MHCYFNPYKKNLLLKNVLYLNETSFLPKLKFYYFIPSSTLKNTENSPIIKLFISQFVFFINETY